MPFTGYTANPATFARVAEEIGFDSLWVPEHPVYPAHPRTEFPGKGQIPEVYSQMADQIVALSMAAAATEKLKLATGVCLVAEHNPMTLAKRIATLDRFCGGRVILGVGAGWLREESELLGVDFPRRWSQTAECIGAMRELWSKPEASFDGRWIKFPAIRCEPKPALQTGPPVVLGSRMRGALRRVAQWADGWCPLGLAPEEMKAQLVQLRAECEAAGTIFDRLEISVVTSVKGDRSRVQEIVSEYAKAGVHRLVVGWRTLGPEEFRTELERLASLYL
ncbi:MAG: LLM class F420-dependent oxidoreductase [Candidatus Binataceae bacterium]